MLKRHIKNKHSQAFGYTPTVINPGTSYTTGTGYVPGSPPTINYRHPSYNQAPNQPIPINPGTSYATGTGYTYPNVPGSPPTINYRHPSYNQAPNQPIPSYNQTEST
jgi:hypothetical protein